ncbi:uncharacterized protein LOC142336950 isoform X2 [Convolutriloba macropyga]|uniref:uncharacterized protein LOC142336950 isoform X2 n=1 Tax=Convolutriloba macropyga TaxID=536237 RepID=UPI003F51DE04
METKENNREPPSSLDIKKTSSGESSNSPLSPPGATGGAPMWSSHAQQNSEQPGSPVESPLFSSSDELRRSIRDDTFANETIEVCSRFFRQTSNSGRKVKRLKKISRSKNKDEPGTSQALGAIPGSRRESLEDDTRKREQERLLRFSRELEALRNRPPKEFFAHAKQSSDTSATTSQLNTLRSDLRFNSGSSNEQQRVIPVEHTRAKSDPIVNRVHTTKLIDAHATAPPINADVKTGEASIERQRKVTAPSPIFRRINSSAAVNQYSIRTPQTASSATGGSRFGFGGSRSSMHSEDNKFKKFITSGFFKKWRAKGKEAGKKKDKESKDKKKRFESGDTNASIVEAEQELPSSQPSSQPTSLSRQNSLSAKIKSRLNIFNTSRDPGYEADREFPHYKEEAKKKRLRTRAQLDSSREPSFSHNDEKEVPYSFSDGISHSKSLQHFSQLQSGRSPQNNLQKQIYANKDFAGSQPAMHHNNLHAGTASAMHSEYDEVFISSAGENQPLPSGASSLQLPEMPNAPLARFDSAMDDDPQLLLSRSSIMGYKSSDDAHVPPVVVESSVDVPQIVPISQPPQIPAESQLPEKQEQTQETTTSEQPSATGAGQPQQQKPQDKFDLIAQRLAEIANEPAVQDIVDRAAIPLDPRQYLGQMIADGDLMGGGAGDDSTERDPDQMREKIRRESVNLISGSLAAHLQGSLAGSLPPTVQPNQHREPNIFTRLRQSAYDEFRAIMDDLLLRPNRGTELTQGTSSSVTAPQQPPAHQCRLMTSPEGAREEGATSTTSANRRHDSNNNNLPSTQSLLTAFLAVIADVVQLSDDPFTQLATNVVLYINEHFRDRVQGSGGYESVFSDQQNSSDENGHTGDVD